MSCGKLEVGIFEGGIQSNEEFAHHGRDRDFELFAACPQTGVEGFEDGVMNAGAQAGHVESAAQRGASAADVALAAEFAAIAIARSQASEGGDLPFGESAQLGRVGQNGGGTDRADAFGLLEPFCLFAQLGLGREVFADEGLEGGELFLQGSPSALGQTAQIALFQRTQALRFGRDQVRELGAAGDQFAQTQLRRRWCRRGRRRAQFSILGEDLRIYPIGLGELAAEAGEVAHLPRISHRDEHLGLVQGRDQRAAVGPGRFADHVDGNAFFPAHPRQEPTMAWGRIGHVEMLAPQEASETFFGDVDAEIDTGFSHRNR